MARAHLPSNCERACVAFLPVRPAVPPPASTFAQISLLQRDKDLVSRFVDTAVEILEAAENVLRAGQTPSEVTILIGSEGGIHMVADSDWPLESLQREHGARMAYRVSPATGRVAVDGRDGSRTCHFESEAPSRAARLLLNANPCWHEFALPQIAA